MRIQLLNLQTPAKVLVVPTKGDAAKCRISCPSHIIPEDHVRQCHWRICQAGAFGGGGWNWKQAIWRSVQMYYARDCERGTFCAVVADSRPKSIMESQHHDSIQREHSPCATGGEFPRGTPYTVDLTTPYRAEACAHFCRRRALSR